MLRCMSERSIFLDNRNFKNVRSYQFKLMDFLGLFTYVSNNFLYWYVN